MGLLDGIKKAAGIAKDTKKGADTVKDAAGDAQGAVNDAQTVADAGTKIVDKAKDLTSGDCPAPGEGLPDKAKEEAKSTGQKIMDAAAHPGETLKDAGSKLRGLAGGLLHGGDKKKNDAPSAITASDDGHCAPASDKIKAEAVAAVTRGTATGGQDASAPTAAPATPAAEPAPSPAQLK